MVIKEAKSWWNGNNERLLREAYGTLIMQSREFKYLRKPSLVAIRRHGPYDIIIILQTNVPGTPLSDNFFKMGQLEAGSVEQDRAVKQFNKPCFAFGQGKGELHSLDLNYQLVPSAENIDADVEGLRGFINRINNLRRQMNGREINSEAMELLIYLYRENPGYLGHILGYVHSSDFIWSEKYMTIGIVDMEAFCSNLNVSLKPSSNISRGYADGKRMLREEGLACGISLSGIEGWTESYEEGYAAGFNGQIPSEANHFYEVFVFAEWVEERFWSMIKTNNIDIDFANKCIDLLENIMQPRPINKAPKVKEPKSCSAKISKEVYSERVEAKEPKLEGKVTSFSKKMFKKFLENELGAVKFSKSIGSKRLGQKIGIC